jgi:DNA mismatch repair ATPase MutS
MFLVNLFVHYSTRRQKDLEIISFPYLINCIKAAGDLFASGEVEIQSDTQKLKELYKASRSVIKKARFLIPVNTGAGDPTAGLFLDYINIFFLLEVRAFFNTSYELSRHALELRELYLMLGKLDALQSMACYRASLPVYTEPEFNSSGLHLEMRDARQPLLDDPVPSSITINKNVVIITGSNMGGKSTFLRTVGTNVLLAQTIVTPSAAFYRGSFYRIITSISRTDDLIAGKSFYFVEAERILRAIRSLDGAMATLCIIDELLSGTNSTERLQASESIIRYLSSRNALAIIATHDLELAGRLNGICDFYHFSGSVDENGLRFDYRLKPGIANSRNAIALLKYLGYPGEIVE